MISEGQRKKIQEEVQEILRKFSKALEKVDLKEKKKILPLGGFREEGLGIPADEDFRKRMFMNAPFKDDDYIYAEKKQW